MRLLARIALIAAAGCWLPGLGAAAVDSNASPSGPAPARVSVLSADQIVKILDDTVDWYRTLGTQQLQATEPSDLLILFANRQIADKVVGLAFDIARANAELLSSEAEAARSAAGSPVQPSLSEQQAQLDAQRGSIEQEMAGHRHTLAAGGKNEGNSAAKLPELQGELAMVNARKNLLDTMQQFVVSSDPKGADANALKAQIDAIAATIPNSAANVAAASAGAGQPPAAAPPSASATQTRAAGTPWGIWDLGREVLRQRSKLAAIDGIDRHTASLAQIFRTLSAPPLAQLKAYTARSDALAAQADTAGSGELKELRNEFDTLAWLFKQTSEILVPLTNEEVLLGRYRHNVGNWRDSAQRQYHQVLTALAIRLGIVAGILALVFALGNLWRRAVLRYAHEPRRRYQLLLVRTIVMWTVVVAVVGLSFVTEISSFATFAGLLTAGLAVAMQSVLVSVVGYFFLIGKYGIRVGDRIQIGTVVGEVIDLGLVRMHLMELNQQGPLGPTGRVVAFANLIVFQAAGGLFKQIPGVNLSWHEMTLTLPAVSDYAVLKEKLLAAIGEAVKDYGEEIARQTREIEKSTASASVHAATPQVQMHLSGGRMEALIRYPVHLLHAAEIDERVAQAVLKVIAAN